MGFSPVLPYAIPLNLVSDLQGLGLTLGPGVPRHDASLAGPGSQLVKFSAFGLSFIGHYAIPLLFKFGIFRPDFLKAAFTFCSSSRVKISTPAFFKAFFLIVRFRNIQLQLIMVNLLFMASSYIT